MHVRNPAGAVLNKKAKLGQIALHRLEEKVVGFHVIFIKIDRIFDTALRTSTPPSDN